LTLIIFGLLATNALARVPDTLEGEDNFNLLDRSDGNESVPEDLDNEVEEHDLTLEQPNPKNGTDEEEENDTPAARRVLIFPCNRAYLAVRGFVYYTYTSDNS